MNFYKKSNLTLAMDKRESIIITSTGNKEKLLKIIIEADKSEYEDYGTDENNEFVIPIIEIEPDKCGNICIDDISELQYEYCGKYDLPTEEIKQLCEKENIPFYSDYLEIEREY